MTLYIILLTIITSISGFSQPTFRSRLIFNPWSVSHRNEWYRFVTCGLLHADYLHLLVNMIVFYSFGMAVEDYYGYVFGKSAPFMYILLYVSAIAAANVTTFFKQKNVPSYNSLGASGGVSAILFTSILFNPMGEVRLYGIIGLPGIIVGIAYIVYSYYMDKQKKDNVHHEAHLWGAVYGLLFTIAMKPSVLRIFWHGLTERF